MYDHRKPTIGRDKTIPGTKGSDVKKTDHCKEPVDQSPIEDKKPIHKPIEDKKPIVDKKPDLKDDKKPEEDKKVMDPWAMILFGPPRQKPVETDQKKEEERSKGFWWF